MNEKHKQKRENTHMLKTNRQQLNRKYIVRLFVQV